MRVFANVLGVHGFRRVSKLFPIHRAHHETKKWMFGQFRNFFHPKNFSIERAFFSPDIIAHIET